MTDHIGPYELRGELGRGAMAVVWRAWDPTLEREVAIKEPNTAGMPGVDVDELGKRFVREGRAAARLNNQNIVAVYAADVFDGRAALVMELVDGSTLSTMITGPMPADFVFSVLDQLLYAVAYAHSRGVIHRDIKPDNVFVTDEGQVKLADFGIARIGDVATLTRVGSTIGTPGYMSPEQVTGSPADARSDIFAVAVIGYEMLTGHNPFGTTEGTDPTSVMYRIVHGDVPPIEQAAPGVPPVLAAVIDGGMVKDPAARFQSANDMRAILHGQAPVMPTPAPLAPSAAWQGGSASTPAATPLPFAQPDRAGGNATVITGPQGAGAGAGPMAQPTGATSIPGAPGAPPVPGAPSSGRPRTGLIVAIVASVAALLLLAGIGVALWWDSTPPTVAITSPKADSSVPSGLDLPVTASASDDRGLARVIILMDGRQVATLSKPPFETTVRKPATGKHLLVATAIDAFGNKKSATVSVDVLDIPPQNVVNDFWIEIGNGETDKAWNLWFSVALKDAYGTYDVFRKEWSPRKGLVQFVSAKTTSTLTDSSTKATVRFTVNWKNTSSSAPYAANGTAAVVKENGWWVIKTWTFD